MPWAVSAHGVTGLDVAVQSCRVFPCRPTGGEGDERNVVKSVGLQSSHGHSPTLPACQRCDLGQVTSYELQFLPVKQAVKHLSPGASEGVL